MASQENTLQKALEGDINAFQSLFAEYQDALKSYLFRLLASRADADDLTHDTFIKAFDALSSFKGKSSLKTWTFSIATNLALNYLKKRQRWTEDVSERAKKMVLARPDLAAKIENIAQHSPYGQYTIREHINTCFTCISKNLPIENQIVLILKDVYDFSIKEIMMIMTKTEGVVKYLLQNGRKTMTDIFDKRCALINKKGVCHQCSELNGWFNPKQDQQEALLQIKLVKAAKKQDKDALYTIRSKLVRAINPLKSAGNELQEILLACNRMAMEGGEI
ncbi:MAG: RNA polymerase sigma factor [Bacteroidota bacterium]